MNAQSSDTTHQTSVPMAKFRFKLMMGLANKMTIYSALLKGLNSLFSNKAFPFAEARSVAAIS